MHLLRILLLFIALLLSACQKAPRLGYTEQPNVVEKRKNLKNHLLELLPAEKRPPAEEEATWLADTAFAASAAIARYNKPVFVNWLNNRMVNSRKNIRQRGLCWHYQHDLYRELRRRPLRHFQLGCCVRDQGRGAEHHVVYIIPRNGTWPRVVMLDAWWHNGRLRFDNDCDPDVWKNDPQTVSILNKVYPEGHKLPLEHWAKVRVGTKYAEYVYSHKPEARKTAQWKHMQEQMKKGLRQRHGKAYSY